MEKVQNVGTKSAFMPNYYVHECQNGQISLFFKSVNALLVPTF